MPWSDCENDLLISHFENNEVAVQWYTIPPRSHHKSHTNFTKISFHIHDFPHEVYIGGVSCSIWLTLPY